MLAEEDKNAEEKSPLDGRWPLSALLAWPRGCGGWAGSDTCACLHVRRDALCSARCLHVGRLTWSWAGPFWRQALGGSAARSWGAACHGPEWASRAVGSAWRSREPVLRAGFSSVAADS